MATEHDWNGVYQSGELPWDTGRPEPFFEDAVATNKLPPGRLLEIGCGTGTNARFFAQHGWDVTAIDVAPRAIERARAGGGDATFAVHDILAGPVAGAPFDAIVDRGCFHVFDGDADRDSFAAHVAASLRPGGWWLSLIGSTEGAPRDFGPPRRSARDVVNAIEPHLEIRALERIAAASVSRAPVMWACWAQARVEPAQPSTRR